MYSKFSLQPLRLTNLHRLCFLLATTMSFRFVHNICLTMPLPLFMPSLDPYRMCPSPVETTTSVRHPRAGK